MSLQVPKFWLGCFMQPKESFSKWVSDGINLVVQPSVATNETAAQVRKAAADAGLFYIDVPNDLSEVEAMMADPACYAVCLPDEASEHMPWYTTPEAQAYVDSFLAKWKPVFDAVKGRKPIWANFGGNRITSGRPWYMGEMILPFTKGCHVNEVCFDAYPMNSNPALDWTAWNAQATNDYNGGKDPLRVPGENQMQFNCRVLQSFCPGMPVWAYLECSKINPGGAGRAPSQAEMMEEANSLLKLGVKGFIFFSHSMGQGLPWDNSAPAGKSAWDGRGPEQVAAVKALAQKLNGSVVQPPSDLQKQLDELKARVVALEAKKVPSGVELKY